MGEKLAELGFADHEAIQAVIKICSDPRLEKSFWGLTDAQKTTLAQYVLDGNFPQWSKRSAALCERISSVKMELPGRKPNSIVQFGSPPLKCNLHLEAEAPFSDQRVHGLCCPLSSERVEEEGDSKGRFSELAAATMLPSVCA
ncbi:hypothetical protein PIB30_097683, partial [Stylosanthes scabra]|nr:hypothetical protein [Stylosanthes scabra]